MADNAATHLYDCLSRLNNIPGNTPLYEAFRRVTGLEEGSAVVAIGSLLGDVQAGLRRIHDIDTEAHLAQIEPLEQWIGHLNLPDRVDHQMPDARAVQYLKICSEQLERSHSLDRLDSDQLEDLHRQALDLLNEVRRAEFIDADLRIFLLGAVKTFIDAIDRYDVYGSAGIDEAIRRSMGDLVIRRPKASDAEAKTLIRKLGEVLAIAAAFMGTTVMAVNYPANIRDGISRYVIDVPAQKELNPASPPALEPGPNP